MLDLIFGDQLDAYAMMLNTSFSFAVHDSLSLSTIKSLLKRNLKHADKFDLLVNNTHTKASIWLFRKVKQAISREEYTTNCQEV
jgi:hypothetical protein